MIIEKEMTPLNKLSNLQLSNLFGGLIPCGEFGSCELIFRGHCEKFSGDCNHYQPPKEVAQY